MPVSLKNIPGEVVKLLILLYLDLGFHVFLEIHTKNSAVYFDDQVGSHESLIQLFYFLTVGATSSSRTSVNKSVTAVTLVPKQDGTGR